MFKKITFMIVTQVDEILIFLGVLVTCFAWNCTLDEFSYD